MKKRSSPRWLLYFITAALGLLVASYVISQNSGLHQGGSGLRQWAHGNGGSAQFSSYDVAASKSKDPAVKTHKNLGGTAMSRPCCVSWGPERVDCFARFDTGPVHHWRRENGKEYEWESLCGTVIGEVECVSRGKGHIDLLVVGSNNGLWTKTYDGYWSEWTSRGGWIMETPSCTARSSATVDCAVRGGNNAGYRIGHTNGKWDTYFGRGGSLQYPISASHRSPSLLDFFAIARDNNLYFMNWTPKRWSGWILMRGGPLQGRPMVVSWNASRIDVFAMGMASRVRHLAWDGRKWLPWEDLGGSLKGVPSCVAFNATIHCFGIGPESNIYRISYVGGKWSQWIRSYGPFQDTPYCLVTNASEVSCYVQDYNREVVEIVYAL